jgi:protein O-mannosyl-transferase
MAKPKAQKLEPKVTAQNVTTTVPPGNNKFTINKWQQYAPIIIVVITALAHATGIFNNFVNWDDEAYIARNELIKSLDFENILKMFDTASIYGGNYHPLVALTNAIEFAIDGMNPRVFHFGNFVFHLLNTFLVFMFCKKLSNGNVLIASIVAMLFGIHPMHVESVAWISERKDVLYSCFYLLSMIAYVNYRQKINMRYLIFAIIFALLSLLSKSMAVTLPLVLIAIDFYIDGKLNLKLLLNKIPFFALSIYFGILAYSTQFKQNYIGEYNFNFLEKFIISCYSSSYYIVKLFLPINLCTLHPFPKEGLPIIYYFAPLFLLGLLIIIIKSKKYGKLLLFGLATYLCSLSVVMQFITVGSAVVCERYTYMPYIGLFFIIATIANDIYNGTLWPNFKKILIPLGVATTILFALGTYLQTTKWKDGVTLWTQTTLQYPETADYAWYGLANALKEQKADKAEVVAAFNKAISINSSFPNYYLNSAAAKSEYGMMAEAMAEYDRCIKLKPNFDLALYNRGILKNDQKDYIGAIADYTKALEINPLYIQARFNRGISNKAAMLLDSAIADYKAVLVQDANFSNAYTNLGNIYYDVHHYQEAIVYYNGGIQHDPKSSQNFLYRGVCNLNLNNKTQGCTDLNTAVQLGNKEALGALNAYCK